MKPITYQTAKNEGALEALEKVVKGIDEANYQFESEKDREYEMVEKIKKQYK